MNIVSFGSGNRWANIYKTTDSQDLAMVGGRVAQVGAGGLLTGGALIDTHHNAYLTRSRRSLVFLWTLWICLQQHPVLRSGPC